MTNAERQAAHQKRKADRLQRAEKALRLLDELLAPNTKPWSLNMRRIIKEALE